MRLTTDIKRGEFTTYNVLAETRTGRSDNVVMVGAHLDSVNTGPGIQDNGSGSAAILEVAVQMARVKTRNKVRFAWWEAEESGLNGSNYYVEQSLTEALRKSIALYLNFDMIGSPNPAFFVYDGDGSSFRLAGPNGSDSIERLFEELYASKGLPWEPTQVSFRSDYAVFFKKGIPFGGVNTGSECIKTSDQAATFGGQAGSTPPATIAVATPMTTSICTRWMSIPMLLPLPPLPTPWTRAKSAAESVLRSLFWMSWPSAWGILTSASNRP